MEKKRLTWCVNPFNVLLSVLFLLMYVSMTSCSEDKHALQGRWEMKADSPDGITLTYVIEIDSEERTYYDEFSDGEKSYGFMDFSNIRRIYHYEIDSIAYLGNNKYIVKSIDSNWSRESIDTLRYNPDTRQLTYGKDWVFEYIPDLKPFCGKWGMNDGSTYEDINLSLYEKIKSPDEYPFNGSECYGWLVYSSEPGVSYRLITGVKKVHYNHAVVKCVFPDYMEEGEFELEMYYHPDNGSLELGGVMYPSENGGKTSSEDNNGGGFGGIWTVLLGIIFLIGFYYLFKVFMGYFFMTLGTALIGAAVGGLILWLLIGGFDLELPRWLIITIMSVTTIPMALLGLWNALKSTGEIVKTPLASEILKGMTKSNSNKIEYIEDEYGNRKKVINVEHGILGEKYIDTEDGKHYRNDGGKNVEEI